MLSQTNVHRLAINKLDRVTAHNRCLRIIDLSRARAAVPEVLLNDAEVHAHFQ